jgi:hypothetical protein
VRACQHPALAANCDAMSPGIRCKPASLSIAAAVVFSLAGIAPAAAASRSAREREARKACLNGDYAKGVSILSDLFVSTLDATYVFNQGRCFEQNRRYEDALGRFDEFLRVAAGKASAEDRDTAEKHILDCKKRLAEERAD